MAQVDSLSFDHVPLNVLKTIPVATYSGDLTVDYDEPRTVSGSLNLALDNVPNLPNITSLNFTNFTIVRVPKTPTSTAVYEITGNATVLGQTVSLEIAYKGKTPHLANSFLRIDGKVVATGENGHVSSMPVCFGSGTRIRVVRDGVAVDVAVEDLTVGDLAVTVSGELRPIRWLGHRVTDCGRHPEPAFVQPIRIAAHAFGPSRPARDLVVSPGHAICLDAMGEILVPAIALVDGKAIVQLDVASVTYWHVELDTHDILVAENLPAESYIEMGNRHFFVEAAAIALHARPDAPIATHADFCRPFVAGGPLLEAVKTRLAAQVARRGSVEAEAKAA